MTLPFLRNGGGDYFRHFTALNEKQTAINDICYTLHLELATVCTTLYCEIFRAEIGIRFRPVLQELESGSQLTKFMMLELGRKIFDAGNGIDKGIVHDQLRTPGYHPVFPASYLSLDL